MAPSVSELLHHHLKYEMDMLNATYSRIGKVSDPVIANAVIESFGLHARALMEFFEKKRGARFYAGDSYKPFDGSGKSRREILVKKLNNQIAHLLDGRTAKLAEKIGPDDQRDLHALITAEYAKFMGCLKPEYAMPEKISVSAVAPSATNEFTASQITFVNTTPFPQK